MSEKAYRTCDDQNRYCDDKSKEIWRLRGDLGRAYQMIRLLMKQRDWGAATGALYEDPVVKAALAAEEKG